MGGVKALLDAIRYAGLIPDDNARTIDLEVTQEVVKKDKRGTRVTISQIL